MQNNKIKIDCSNPEYKRSSETCQLYVPPRLPFTISNLHLKIPHELKTRNAVITKDSHTSTYQKGYPLKHWETNQISFGMPKQSLKIQYLSTLDKKFSRNPPKPFKTVLSETKSKYTVKADLQQHFRRELCPSQDSYCELKDLGKDFQQFFPPEESNFVKYMDPYLTTNCEYHYPFTLSQWNGIAKKNTLTIYDFVDPPIPKCKGFGVKNPPHLGSLYPNNAGVMYDRIPFRHSTKLTQVPRTETVILKQGRTTETMDQYRTPSESPLFTESLRKIECHMSQSDPNVRYLEIINTKRNYNPESKFYGSNVSTVSVLEPRSKKYRK